MSKKAEEREELQTIQKDLAIYLYSNYILYTRNEEQLNNLKEEYNQGKGNITEEEYLERAALTREYENINKIEFTGFSKSPMGGLEVSFLINDVYSDMTHLLTRYYETEEWRYSINSGNKRNDYVLRRRETPTTETFPDGNIIYYEGGIE